MTEQRLSSTYTEARRQFLAACGGAGAAVTSHPHPLAGPESEELAIDVAELGDPTASSTLAIVSGTHGSYVISLGSAG